MWDLLHFLAAPDVAYSSFKQMLHSSQIESAVVHESYLQAITKEGESINVRRLSDPMLVADMEKAGVDFQAPTNVRPFLLYGFFPVLGLTALLFVARDQLRKPLSAFGSRAKSILIAEYPKEDFDSIAGCEEAKEDLKEMVDFFRSPERFERMGAVLPKGVLLSGPPGTGKTLLARALARESNIPFYAVSGSDFVEKYVGVGAARVRSLFKEVRRNQPCIVFIDEIDVLGKDRNREGHEEREQTLNQLLVELDGFSSSSHVVLLAATNRPEVIDPALTRPGRFDRQIVVDAPDKKGRVEILKIHCAKRQLCPGVNFEKIAESTPGMAGANLANLVNEAALLAAREHAECIAQSHFSEALERILAGPIRTNRLLDNTLRERIAYHEAGHALVAYHSKTADPVHKISIVPRGKAALGYTLQIPASDQYLMTQTELEDRVRVLLAGRAAELLIYHEVSSGAENDLERCTAMVRRMIGHFGMGRELGLLHLGRDLNQASSRSLGLADAEVSVVLEKIFQEASDILRRHRDSLELVTRELLDKEVLDGTEFEELVSR